MTNISERLISIANYIESKDKIIDIGCDHALLDIYLVKNKNIKKIIASDIVEDAIVSARKTVEKYNLSNNIDLRCGNGLNVLNNNDVIDTIVMSGLGYNKIINILKDGNNKLNNINTIIVQSNTFPQKIRKYIVSIGYYIVDEKIIKENNIFYTIIFFKKGRKIYSNFNIRCGPILLKNKEKIYKDYIDLEIKTCKLLLKSIPNKYIVRRIKILIELQMLNKAKKHLIN